MKHRIFVVTACVSALVPLAACSEESRDSIEDEVRSVATEAVEVLDEASEDAVEAAARNFASSQGAEEFSSAGHPIDGDLSCEADATDDLTAVELACTGTTDDGGRAELTGTTDELPGLSIVELNGDFVGTVDGEEVFSTRRLGG